MEYDQNYQKQLLKEGKISELFLQVEKFIAANVKRYLNIVPDYDEAYAIACLSFLKAVKSFDESKNYAFITLLSQIIRNDFLMVNRKNQQKNKYIMISLSEHINDSDNITYEDIISDDNDDPLYNIFKEKEEIKQLHKAIQSLTQDEQMIVNLVLKGKNQRTIAKTMNCCQPTISRKIKLILTKLKKYLEEDDGILKNA